MRRWWHGMERRSTVCFCDHCHQHILKLTICLEFWRIRSLVEHTAHGVRRQTHDDVPLVKSVPQILFSGTGTDDCRSYSQASLMTDVSDDRHLGLVFFDILMLNSTSLLSVPYSSRRAILESVIKPVPSRAILADRTSIALNLTPNDTNPPLHRVFAQCLALPEEGLVLKASEAGYNDVRFPWVKLKRDYIPGYGDCVDLVLLGGSWDKSRARELRGWFRFQVNLLVILINSFKLVLARIPHFISAACTMLNRCKKM